MTKVITFLGIYPQSTTYVMPDGNICTAQFFGAALARVLPGLEFCVFVTDKAAENSLDKFTEEVTGQVATLTPIRIPDGDNEEQLWHIFEKVVETVKEGDRVIFDITHSFRSVTFLSFLAAAYLRTVKRIDLVSVLYGNFEAARKHPSGYAPVIDMTSFVSLLDWMVAADRFIRSGDASDLAQRLQSVGPNLRDVTQTERNQWSETGIPQLAATLTTLSRALLLIRPYEAMDASERLRLVLPSAIESTGRLARPFTPLSQQIADSFACFALAEQQQKQAVRALEVERSLIDWHLSRNQLVQAVAVAREWMISYLMVHTLGPKCNLLDKEERKQIENALGWAIQKEKRGYAAADEAIHLPLQPADKIKELVDLYNQLGDCRNDLMHAGKRARARKSKDLAAEAKGLCKRLDELPIPAQPQ